MDPRVTELHCIMPIANIGSVLAHGILSYERAAKLAHRSVALQPVQDKRDKKSVPGGLKLHQYANLYFNARNPMLYKRLGEVSSICVLRISTAVMQVRGTVITDGNAASDYVRFLDPKQWKFLAFDDIYATDWRHPGDQVAYWKHKSRMCAEVLVPNLVESKFIEGAYVADKDVSEKLRTAKFDRSVVVSPTKFFR
ncbi:DUF4433 domain-containing protein [Steroidobacter flavus]|uniref:DUF4433 domain-containing protein n=1 Tax=Steroidobacter flavus TaxID=1842136 RepID=A0ABV8SL63_9GAMM